MKRFIAFLLVLVICVSFSACTGAQEPEASITPEKGEIQITATVMKATDNGDFGVTLLLCDSEGTEYVFGCDENVTIIEDGVEIAVLDSAADYFRGKTVTVIVSEQIQETYPLGLTGERMVIIEKEG